MSTRKVKAGEAYVELVARDKMAGTLQAAEKRLASFAAGAQAIGQSIAAVGAGLMAGGTAILGALSGAAKMFADTGGQVQTLANRTGVAADHLSELIYAAEQSGASIGDLEAALRTLAKKGIAPADFDRLAADVAAVADPTERAAKAIETFGKAGYKLLPMLGELQALRGQARDLGLSISPEAAARALALGDAFSDLLKVAKDVAFEVGFAVADPLTRMIQAMTHGVVAVASFVEKNQQLVVALAAMAVVAVAAGAVLVALGTALVGVAVASQALVAIYAALAAPFVLVGAGIAAITAALLLGAGAWLVFSQAGQAALASLGQVLQGLVNAIAAGNLLNAWGQLGTAMVMVWKEAGRMIVAAFYRVADQIGQIMESVTTSLADMLAKIGATDLSRMVRGAAVAGGAAIRAAGANADDAAKTEIAGLQAQLDALRGLVAPEAAARVAAINLPRISEMLDTSAAMGAGAGGGAAGTFSAAGAGLLGRAAPALEREAKEQTGLLKGIKDVLSDIDDGIDELEGFAMG